MTIIDNYYCSQKFWALSINLERGLQHSCCAADPEKINLGWLKENPGMLFNTPMLQQERKNMLSNIPVKSCESNCWNAERQGLTSRRMLFESHKKTHTDIDSCVPRTLSITIGSTCNLTCSYCCKQYSTAWMRDIGSLGPYFEDKRYELTQQDKLLLKINNQNLADSKRQHEILDQLFSLDSIDQVSISGGEPMLYKNLPDLVNRLSQCKEVIVYTGLGIGITALKKQISKIRRRPGLKIIVSAENCHSLYEFNRFGISFQHFLDNLIELKKEELDVSFSSTLSNLTVVGFAEFFDMFKQHEIDIRFCNDPDYLNVSVLDETTKNLVINAIENSNVECKKVIVENISKNCSLEQKEKFAMYFKEFSRRRALDTSIFPCSMLTWIGI